jgi:hypothetical protein
LLQKTGFRKFDNVPGEIGHLLFLNDYKTEYGLSEKIFILTRRRSWVQAGSLQTSKKTIPLAIFHPYLQITISLSFDMKRDRKGD